MPGGLLCSTKPRCLISQQKGISQCTKRYKAELTVIYQRGFKT